VVDFVEICNVCIRKVIIKAAKRIFNSDKICCSYCNFYFGVTFLEHTVLSYIHNYDIYAAPRSKTNPEALDMYKLVRTQYEITSD